MGHLFLVISLLLPLPLLGPIGQADDLRRVIGRLHILRQRLPGLGLGSPKRWRRQTAKQIQRIGGPKFLLLQLFRRQLYVSERYLFRPFGISNRASVDVAFDVGFGKI